MTAAVLSVRIEPTADASLAAILERSKFGIAIAAMIKMIATTIRSSISEKPLRLFLMPKFPFLCFALTDSDGLAPTKQAYGHSRALGCQVRRDGAQRAHFGWLRP